MAHIEKECVVQVLKERLNFKIRCIALCVSRSKPDTRTNIDDPPAEPIGATARIRPGETAQDFFNRVGGFGP